MRAPEQVPRLRCLEGFKRSQLVYHLIRYGKHLAFALVVSQSLCAQLIKSLHGQRAVVAELNALPERLALAGIGLFDGHNVGLLLVRLLGLLGKIASALDRRRRRGGKHGAGRERSSGEHDGVDSRRDGDDRPDQAPQSVCGRHDGIRGSMPARMLGVDDDDFGKRP